MALQLTATTLPAQSRGVDSLFPAQPVGYINDFANLLDPGSEAALDTLVQRLKAATGAEVVAVTLSTIGRRDEAEVALAIGRRWDVGAKGEPGDPRRNAGLVLLLVPRLNRQPGTDHVRIETGYGLEGVVTDAAAGRIREIMRPDLEREAYGPALTKGVQALVSTVARGYGVSDSVLTAYQLPAERGGRSSTLVSILPIALFILFVLMSGRGSGGRRRRRQVYWAEARG